ncbi:DegV family protein [Bacillus timonensis]|nr:DegV family protein [Bacillus timonensis]
MTKKKIAWVTDSTAFITTDLANHPDVYVVPLGIVFGDEVFEDGVDLTTDELYKRINNEKTVPKTSQPAVGKMVELYEKLKTEYEHAVAIHVSSKLSGTLSSSKSAAEMADFQVEVIDSKSMSYAITTLIYKGMELAEQNLSLENLASALREEVEKHENYILLGSLDQFYKGGRMSGTQFLLGNLLQIKPIIRINNKGEFELFEKVRSEKKAAKRILELFEQSYQKYNITHIQIMHGNVLDKAKAFEAEFKALYPNLDIFIGEISSTIAVHAGEGTVAFIWNKE